MLTFSHPPLVWIIGTLVGAAVAWWAYARPGGNLSRPRRILLAVLRGLALGLVAFLLAGPLVKRFAPQETPATVAILADDSRSVGVLDSLVGRTFARQIDAFAANLGGPARFDRARFDRAFSPATTLADLRFRGVRTDLALALARAADRNAGRNLQAVVVFTDGRATTGRDPLAVAQTLGVPVFPVMLGDTARAARALRRDVAVEALLANRSVAGGSVQPVEVRVTAEGFAGQSATVSLSVNGAAVASKSVVLPPDGGLASVALDYTPPSSGAVALVASVSRLPGEATYVNNTLGRTVDVKSERLKVLLLAGAPDPDVAVVRDALEADAGFEVTVRVQKAPGQFYDGGGVSPATFDVAMLVGFPGPASDPALVAQIADAPRLGVVFVPTTRTDAARLAPLTSVLAASPGVLGAPQPLALAPAGSSHPALEGVPHLDALGALPPLPVASATVADGGRVLWRTASGAPALVVERRGPRGTAVLLAGGLWAWRSLPPSQEAYKTLVPTLLPRLVRFAAPTDAGTGLIASASAEAYGPDEAAAFSATATDEAGRPLDGASVDVELNGPGGARHLAMQPMGEGRFGLTVPDLPPGLYRWRATAGGVAGAASGAFRVDGANESGGSVVSEELRRIGPDAGMLRALAEATGGDVYTLATLDSLKRRLETSPQFRPALVTRDEADPLGDRWPFFVLVVALLAAEWTLRRRWGLV